MKTKILLFIAAAALVGCNSNKIDLPESARTVDAGTLYELKLFAPEFDTTMTIEIWTPDNYSKQTKYSTIYMHDGQNLFDPNSTWNHQSWNMDSTVQMLINQQVISPTIVVGIHSFSDTRVGDLMPQKLIELIDNDSTLASFRAFSNGNYRGEKYLQFIVNQLKPTIDSIFSTDHSCAATCVMGSSMGGLISLAAIAEHPETFGAAACLSTHINNPGEAGGLYRALEKYLTANLKLSAEHKIYIDCGDLDVDSDYVPYFEPLKNLLDSLTTAEIKAEFFENHSHSEKCWEQRADIPIKFMLKNND